MRRTGSFARSWHDSWLLWMKRGTTLREAMDMVNLRTGQMGGVDGTIENNGFCFAAGCPPEKREWIAWRAAHWDQVLEETMAAIQRWMLSRQARRKCH